MPSSLALAFMEAEERKHCLSYPEYEKQFPFIVIFQAHVPDSLRYFVGNSFTRCVAERFRNKKKAVEYCRILNVHMKKFHPERYGKDFYFIHKQ